MSAVIIVRLDDASFDAAAEIAAFHTGADGSDGAVASFTGLTRATDSDGEPVAAMTLHAYRGMTLASMESIAASVAERHGVTRLLVIHRAGRMAPGEPVVLVAAAAPHRRAAFDAVDEAMDRLKSEAIFWKSEDSAVGTRWIEPTAGDAAALARWHSAEGEGNARD